MGSVFWYEAMAMGAPLLSVTFLLLAALTSGVRGRRCYSCSTNPSWVTPPYQPECGDDYYDGNTAVSEDNYYDQCFVQIEARTGYVNRRLTRNRTEGGNYATGYYEDSLMCVCSSNKCNTGICDECQQPTTPVPTTQSPETGLSCYSCSNCGSVDVNTTVIQNTDYTACTTTFLLNLDVSVVIRGASKGDHVDGECLDEANGITCYCATPNCNDASYSAEEGFLDN